MVSEDKNFQRVREFHRVMDGEVPDLPRAFDTETALHRSGFKLEEIVEFLAATASDDAAFEAGVSQLHQALDAAAAKVSQKKKAPESAASPLVDQADALLDLLYFTYGSFVLMGVNPAPIFDLVHAANMGKIWPDGRAHYDPVTHKILKPADWEETYAPEAKIAAELERQQARGE